MAHPSAPGAAEKKDGANAPRRGEAAADPREPATPNEPAAASGPIDTHGSAATGGSGGSAGGTGSAGGRGGPAQPVEPAEVGPYRLLRRLGAGGMGTVYLGENAAGGQVAVKLIRPDLARLAEFRVRLKQEADNARRVARFCTAAVLDVDITGEQPYLVTEYVDGPTLAEAVARRGPLTPAELHQLAVSITTALMAIHRAGIVHRDLKPSNILLSRLGPKVIDFGIARALDTATRIGPDSGADRHLGTPAFMAPEQARGEQITSAADVFAWGGVLIYAGTGRFPFGSGDAPGLLYRTVNDPPNLDGLDGSLRPLVEDAMRKTAAYRPGAEQLYARLLDLRVDVPVKPRALAEVTALIRPLNTLPPRTGGAAVEGDVAGPITPVTGRRPSGPPPAVATGGSMGAAVHPGRSDRADADADADAPGSSRTPTGAGPGQPSGSARTSGGSTGSGEAAPSGEFPVWHPADQWEVHPRVDDGLITVWNDRDTAGRGDGRRRPAMDPADELTGLVPAARVPTRPDGGRAAAGRGPGPTAGAGRPPRTASQVRHARIQLIAAVVTVVAVLVGVVAVLASRNGGKGSTTSVPASVAGRAIGLQDSDPALARRLALAAYQVAPTLAETRAAMIGLFGGHVTPVTTEVGSAGVLSAAVSRDGQRIATGDRDGVITLWQVTDRTTLTRLDSVPSVGWIDALAFNAGGDLLVSGSTDGTVRLWNLADPRNIHRWSIGRVHTDAVRTVAFSPDGNTLASSGADGVLALWDVTDPARPTTRSHVDTATGGVYEVAFAKGGQTLAVAGEDGSVGLWDIRDQAHPTRGQVLRDHTRAVRAVTFTTDGASLVSGGIDATVRLWDVTDPAHPTPQGTIPGQFGGVASVAGGDGGIVASGGDDETVRLSAVSNPAQPEPLVTWPGHTQPISAVAVIPHTGVVLSAGNDGTVRLWDADPGRLATAACTDPANHITTGEWASTFGSMAYHAPCP
ncbi:WD40 repeat domain-containing serine/threonine protein kinase [Frankia sp. AgB32]|uniref:WD40 repeat domain-containing serine/threonine protein kinase n=1 Tax=Frankia sp. AgB32 TaxID=631119 RepID=UPI002010046C|nr:serine/threonine-protein kinase [Frankia sp. AgB32]MCK9896211.1 protein kinase [Frankia sp. AgB32]